MWLAFIAPDEGRDISWAIVAVIAATFVITVACLLTTSLMDPGFIPRQHVGEVDAQAVDAAYVCCALSSQQMSCPLDKLAHLSREYFQMSMIIVTGQSLPVSLAMNMAPESIAFLPFSPAVLAASRVHKFSRSHHSAHGIAVLCKSTSFFQTHQTKVLDQVHVGNLQIF